ncbi:MAG: hypothetical protein J6T16_00715, partial [Opitutales bacterium]|nr:hypothetical protein [Opitutales bacterium]
TIAAGSSGRIPYAAADRNGRIIRNRFGNPEIAGYSISNLDESELKKIAEITGGQFYRATDYKNLQSIYDKIDSLEKTEVKIRNFTEYRELFAYPLTLALALLMLERLLANTRLRRLP